MASQVTPRWEIPPYKLRWCGCRNAVDAIECKWNPDAFDPAPLAAFRAIHPQGRNYLVCPASTPAHVRSSKGLKIHVVNPMDIPA
jgi:hypothetical protein